MSFFCTIMSLCTSPELHKRQFEQLNHPPYSPDPAPSGYYVFLNLKSNLRGMRFQDDDKLIAATEVWGPNRRLLFQKHRLLKRKCIKVVKTLPA